MLYFLSSQCVVKNVVGSSFTPLSLFIFIYVFIYSFTNSESFSFRLNFYVLFWAFLPFFSSFSFFYFVLLAFSFTQLPSSKLWLDDLLLAFPDTYTGQFIFNWGQSGQLPWHSLYSESLLFLCFFYWQTTWKHEAVQYCNSFGENEISLQNPVSKILKRKKTF